MARWVEPADIPGPKGQEFLSLAQDEWGEAIDLLTSEFQGVPNVVSCLMEEIGYQCVRYRQSSTSPVEERVVASPPEPPPPAPVTAASPVTGAVVLSATVRAVMGASVVEGMTPSAAMSIAEEITSNIMEALNE